MAVCGEGGALCPPCSLPAHELTQQPGCGGPLETIVAAACIWGQLVVSIPRPARHHHIIHDLWAKTGQRVPPAFQGFVTSRGRFVDRREGLQIALASGQPMIDHPSRHPTQLFSEDLW